MSHSEKRRSASTAGLALADIVKFANEFSLEVDREKAALKALSDAGLIDKLSPVSVDGQVIPLGRR